MRNRVLCHFSHLASLLPDLVDNVELNLVQLNLSRPLQFFLLLEHSDLDQIDEHLNCLADRNIFFPKLIPLLYLTEVELEVCTGTVPLL